MLPLRALPALRALAIVCRSGHRRSWDQALCWSVPAGHAAPERRLQAPPGRRSSAAAVLYAPSCRRLQLGACAHLAALLLLIIHAAVLPTAAASVPFAVRRRFAGAPLQLLKPSSSADLL